ncbi:MAG: PF20097 family protein [Eubacterium sp.]
MICPKCGREMRKGYLFSSKDGAFSFAGELPGALEPARKAEGYVRITGLKAGGRASVKACCCDVCRMILLTF